MGFFMLLGGDFLLADDIMMFEGWVDLLLLCDDLGGDIGGMIGDMFDVGLELDVGLLFGV